MRRDAGSLVLKQGSVLLGDLLVVRGALPSIGNIWVLALVVGYLYTVRCWCGCWLLTAEIRYVYLEGGRLPSVAVVKVSCTICQC